MLDLSAALVGSLLKAGSPVAKEPVRKLLATLSFRWRVAKAVARDLAKRRIKVSRKRLRRWMASDLAAQQLQFGTAAELEHAVVALRDVGSARSLTDDEAGQVLESVLTNFMRESEPSHAVAAGTSWVGQKIDGSETRLSQRLNEVEERVLGAIGMGTAFRTSDDAADDLARLHQWRRDKGAELLREHQPLAELLHMLVGATDKGAVLDGWAASTPPQLAGAPPIAWTWLGDLAADFGTPVAASHFFQRAFELNVENKAYWMARAVACLLGGDDQSQIPGMLAAGADQHPLGRAIKAELAADLPTMYETLEAWAPEDPTAAVIRAVSLSRVLADTEDDLNAAVAVLTELVGKNQHSSGAAMELGKLLLHRARSGRSDHAGADSNRALNLAIQARDARRSWGGDSSAGVVLAVMASALMGDLDRAWRLTQVEGGEATEEEAANPDVRREVGLLASLTDRHELATLLADELNDPYITAMNDAFQAMKAEDPEGEKEGWARAFAHATGDSERLTTAMFLAEVSAALPDLADLETRHPKRVHEIRIVHDVMSTPHDKIAVLRARVHESPRLAIALAAHYNREDDFEKAGDTLVDAGDRHRDAILLRMGAERYMRARKFAQAQAAAERALALGGPTWPGEFDARAVLHDSLMAQGNSNGALAQAQALVALAPDDRGARWALVAALMRRNEGEPAWRALCPDGAPIDPRTPFEARLWVQLAEQFDHGPRFVPRVLAMISRWPDDEDLQGWALARMFFVLGARPDEPEDQAAEGQALREAAEAFEAKWPESQTFRSIKLGPDDDPLGPLREELAAQATVLDPLLQRVKDGEVPLGILTATGRTYAEAVLRRAGGMVRSYDPPHAEASAQAIEQARQHGAIIDTTALGTLVTLNENVQHTLIGAVARVETSEGAYLDALAAQASLGIRSTMSVGYDTEDNEPRVHQINQDEADLLANRAEALADLAGTLSRRSRSQAPKFDLSKSGSDWLAAFEIARDSGLPFWCDDLVLARMARREGVECFSTVDLMRLTLSSTAADADLLEVAEGTLIANFHVDLGFNAAAMRFAAGLDNWAARGAAFALGRSMAWAEPQQAGAFLLEAIDKHSSPSEGSLVELQAWAAAGTLGAVHTAPDDESASDNAAVVLGTIIARPWIGADQLAAAVHGVRVALRERPTVTDPLEHVLREFYKFLVSKSGHGLSSTVFMSLVRQLPEDDRQVAVRIVLETD